MHSFYSSERLKIQIHNSGRNSWFRMKNEQIQTVFDMNVRCVCVCQAVVQAYSLFGLSNEFYCSISQVMHKQHNAIGKCFLHISLL